MGRCILKASEAQAKPPDLSGPLFKHLGRFADPKIAGQGHNPAESKAQRRFMAMCEHHPEQARGECPDMTKEQYRHFTRTRERGLPERKRRG